LVRTYIAHREKNEWDLEGLFTAAKAWHTAKTEPLDLEELKNCASEEALTDLLKDFFLDEYAQREGVLPEPLALRHAERMSYLRAVDTLWMQHLDDMTALRQNVAFSGYAQKDPLIEYKRSAFELFTNLLSRVRTDTVQTLFKIDLQIMAPPTVVRAPIHLRTNEGEIENLIASSSLEGRSAKSERSKIIADDISPDNFSGTREGVTVIRADDGENNVSVPKLEVGRNDPCVCGSGKKYKKCCGRF
jgi:preprotein translocase subunit SecA